MQCVLGIDQSTQGTKLILFNQEGQIIYKKAYPHKQIKNDLGYISHDMNEIYNNILLGIKDITQRFNDLHIKAVGITNQRETTVAFDQFGIPLDLAVVWQCGRAKPIVDEIESQEVCDMVYDKTGIPLSCYFPASKIAWLKKYSKNVKNNLNPLFGTVDTYLVYRLTNGKSFYTDYSNASRTELFNIHTLKWDNDILNLFNIDIKSLPIVKNSNDFYGETNFDNILDYNVPILSIMGDSHAALYAEGCFNEGMMKITYGTGSSIMLNIGRKPLKSKNKLITSIAYGIDGNVDYVLEGNVNYAGAVISWLKNDLGLIDSLSEIENIISSANKNDETILIPAFTGLGAPYWCSDIKASIVNISINTCKSELVKAGVESIALQINDIITCLKQDYDKDIKCIRADGGASSNKYLINLQANLSKNDIYTSYVEELSAMGVAYMAGIKCNLYNKDVFKNNKYSCSLYDESKNDETDKLYNRWIKALSKQLN